MPRERLTPLDHSFLRIESPTAHMHVAARGRFEPPPGAEPITLERVRALVASRLHLSPRFRQRLAFPPGGLSAPVWTDDAAFDLDRHVVALGPRDGTVPLAAFAALTDAVLSEPLDRGRPLWRMHLVPRLADGTVGLVLKAHHAMVDGLSALELGLLVLDGRPDAPPPPLPEAWRPKPVPRATRLAVDALADYGTESLRAARGMVGAVGHGRRIADTVRRTALAIEADVLRPSPASYLNQKLGARRCLGGHRTDVQPLLDVRRSRGTTLNDVVLAVVTGALARLAAERGERPQTLKAMVPVSRRAPGGDARDAGNRIAFVSVQLPLHMRGPLRRLDEIAAQSRAFKADDRAAGNEGLMSAVGLLPPPLQDAAARFAASGRAYNLVVSNVPGPRFPVFLLGARCREAFPVVPLSDGHALSVGALSIGDDLCLSAYSDPAVLPEATCLPAALAASVDELVKAAARRPARVA